MVVQADRSEWANLRAEAEQNDQQWLKNQLEQRNLTTLRQFSVSASLGLGRNPSKEVCIAALVEHQFPLASRYGKELHMLGGKLKADCVALLLQMFDIPFCVSPFVVYIIVCVAWCDPGTSIGVGEASCFCSSTRSGVVERDT